MGACDFKPYIRKGAREKLFQALSQLELGEELEEVKSDSFHVPFSSEELIQLRQFLVDEYRMILGSCYPDSVDQIIRLLKSNEVRISQMLKALAQPKHSQLML